MELPPDQPLTDESARTGIAVSDDLALFFEQAPVPMCWVGPDGTVLRVNQAKLDLLGYPRDQVLNRPVTDFYVEPEPVIEIFERLQRDESVRDHAARLRRRNGDVRDVLITSNVHRDGGRVVLTRWVVRDVTERRHAEHDHALLAAIVESSDDAIVSKTLDGVITSWNGGAQRIFGYTAEEAIGRPITMLIPPELLHEEDHILNRIRSGQRIEHLETVRVTKAGERVDVRLSVSSIRDPSGRIIGVSKLARDIRQEKEAVEALRRSEQRHRSLLRAISSVVWTTDPHGQVCEAAPDWEAYTGMTWEEYHAGGWIRALHPDDREHVRRAWDEAMRLRTDYRIEARVWHEPSREYRHIVGRAVPILEVDGSVAEWIGTYVDVHDRKTAEAELEESRRHFEQVLNLLPAGVFSCRADGTIDYYNQLAAEMWRRQPVENEPLRRFLADVHVFDAAGQRLPWDQTPTMQTLRDGRPRRSVELQIAAPDHSRTTVLANTDAIRDRDGAITGAVCAFIDVTDLKRTQEQLTRFNEELERRVAERTAQAEHRARQLRALTRELALTEQQERQRIAALLHDDLVQQLAVAKIQLGLLARRIREAPEKVSETLIGLEELIDASIRFTRTLMSDLTPPTLNRNSLSAAIRWVAEKFQKHRLTVEIHEDRPLDHLPEDVVIVLFQSVREMLFNVVKHAGVHHAIVALKEADDRIEVSVTDHGRGFDTTRPIAPSSEGGFGLFHLRERLEVMGGELAIESALGRGTCVTIRVPSAFAPPEEAPAPSAARPADEPAGPPIRVLLIDDHAMIREGLRHVMQQCPDIEVVGEADNGEEGIEATRRLKPDVVLMDVNLPRLNGPDATRIIRAEVPGVQVIGLSIHNDEDVIAAMREAGAAAYLTKNEAPDALHATIRALRQVGGERA